MTLASFILYLNKVALLKIQKKSYKLLVGACDGILITGSNLIFCKYFSKNARTNSFAWFLQKDYYQAKKLMLTIIKSYT